MMGIGTDVWEEACQRMGLETAATVFVCILQRITRIHSPGAYLRTLTTKAEAGLFSAERMIMALDALNFTECSPS